VFDPLAVILLLSSQISFQNFRERETAQESVYFGPSEYIPDPEEDTLYAPNVGEKPTAEELKDDLFPTFEEITEGDSPEKEPDVVSTATVTTSILEQHPYLNNGFTHFEGLEPMVYTPEPVVEQPKEYVVEAALIDALEGTVNRLQQENDDLKNQLEDLRKADFEAKLSNAQKTEIQSLYSKIHQLETKLTGSSEYVQNEEQSKSGLWRAINSKISEEEYIDKIRKQNDNTDNAA
jgi:hypothetical protein